MKQKTLRMIFPQWHGGVNPDYVPGAFLMSVIAPPSAQDETVQIAVQRDFDEEAVRMDGIDCGPALLREMTEAAQVLADKQPDRVIVFGGDCSVTQIPFDYLSGKYGDALGILWLDAHPDISGTKESAHLHEMVLADLLGQNPQSALTRVKHPVTPNRALMAGLIEEELRPMDRACRELRLRIVSPERLRTDSEPILDWITQNGIRYLAVHWDLDVLSPEDFRSIYPAEPYTNVSDFPAAVGQMTLAEVGRVLKDASAKAEIVGLSMTEHLPWDALRMRKTLGELAIFQD